MSTPQSTGPQPLPIRAGQHVAIAGAGLVGSLLGIWLARKGFKVSLLDKRPQPGTAKFQSQPGLRSINLALSHRGWKALRAIDTEAEIREIAVPMSGRVVHDLKGQATHFPYGTEGQAIYSVSRGRLNQVLNEKAQQFDLLEILYDTRARGVNFDTTTLVAEGPGGMQRYPADVVIACDGAYSSVRQSFQFSDRFDFSQHYIDSGYQEYHMDAQAGGQWKMRNDGLHIWPRKNFMMIGLPNPDGTFTCTLFLAFEGEQNSFAALKNPAYRRRFFQDNFPDLIDFIPDYDQQAVENPVSSLVTIHCHPWNRNRVLLIGDAAHGIVPFYGQGMNAGFEDVDILMSLMDEMQAAGEVTWENLFDRFARRRKPGTDAIAALALDNFVEMRERVADPEFQWFKKIDAALSRLFPDEWVPLYTMISFTSTPYEEARSRGARQERIGYQIMQLPNARQNWEDDDWLQEAYARVAEGD